MLAEDAGDLLRLMVDMGGDLHRELTHLTGMLMDTGDQIGKTGQFVFLTFGVVGPLQGDHCGVPGDLPHCLGSLAQLFRLRPLAA